MPLPKPNSGESKEDFISRCMGSDTMNAEYPDQAQRAAMCNSQWGKEYTEFQEQQTYDINDIEIFAVGKWNGDKYTEKDLDDMVTAFHELKNEIKPYLKLGHDKDQALLQKDGMPSAGWIVNLKRKGEKLLADFKGIPKKIKELIEKKAYGRISSEIYWGLQWGDKKYRRVVRAAALLGADTPAVSNLDDFINLYENNEFEELKIYDEENDMSDELIKSLEGKIKEYSDSEVSYKTQLKTYKDEIVQHKETIVGLETEVKTLTEKIETKEQEQKETEIKLFIDKQLEDVKILPSQVEQYTELAKKDFDSIKAIMENMPKLPINDNETSQAGKKPKNYTDMDESEKDEYLVEKTNEYMKEHEGIEFKDALVIVQQELGE